MQEILKKYKTTLKGLTSDEARNRIQEYGLNKISAGKKKPLIIKFLEEFKDLMVIILLIASIISFLAGEKTDAVIIMTVVLINAFIGFIQKFKAEKALEALQKLVSPKARIIRNNEETEIEAENLVPGDIIILNEGNSITADCVLIEGSDLNTQESILTGESTPVSKIPMKDKINKDCELYMGTIIAFGTGKALVINTGMNTKFGRIADLTANTKKDLSPLQKELMRIGAFVGKITLIISIILLIVGVFFQGKHFLESLLFSVSVAVAAVPEGLPATITIALALGVQKLAKKNAIIKELASVETLGSTTVICSDKTGTLTKNQMTAQEIYTPDYHITISGVGYGPKGELQIKNDGELISIPSLNNPIFEKIAECSLLCNNAKIIKNEQNQYECLGDPTEGALLTLVEKTGLSSEKINKNFPRIKEFPFSSDRKMMSTVHKKNFDFIIFVKGAPDQTLKKCSKYLNQKGEIKKLTPKIKAKIAKENNEMAAKALRVLALSYKEEHELKNFEQKEIEDDLIFIGLVGIIDPPREEVKKAVELTQKAGIKTYIITGDYGLTASAIAYELGIIKNKNPKIITGDELNKLNETDLLKIFKQNPDLIFARVNPEHKLKIVSALKKRGEIVAVTGDGVNDAPALKRADIGVSMGITGTDVSKEAANMVLADDSFASIVTAIQEGRTIYENLKKFIYYVFSSNIGELVTVFAALLLALPSPLTAILILSVNLGTDIFPALALGVEPTEEKVMNIPPRDPKSHIMNKKFIFRFFIVGFFIGTIVIGSFIYYLYQYDWQWGIKLEKSSIAYLKGSTIAFSLLVLIQMANAFNARSEKESFFKLGIFKNRWLIGAISLSLLILVLMVEVPAIQKLLHTTHLTGTEWMFIITASLSVLIFEEFRKLINR